MSTAPCDSAALAEPWLRVRGLTSRREVVRMAPQATASSKAVIIVLAGEIVMDISIEYCGE